VRHPPWERAIERHEPNENNSQKDTSEEQEIASQKKEMKTMQLVGRF